MADAFIDKIALIYIKNRQILMALSKGNDAYYIPGGKREGNETDEQALVREIREELNVKILPQTMEYYGVFTAQAHGKPAGVTVQMTCYAGNFSGQAQPGAEIQDLAYYGYSRRNIVGPVDQLIFDNLKKKNLID